MPSKQVALFSHKLGSQSLMLISHRSPVKPFAQLQVNPPSPMISLHVAPLAQGDGVQSPIVNSQNVPVNPGRHLQLKPFTSSIHVALFMQKLGEQSSIFISHNSPVNPAGH